MKDRITKGDLENLVSRINDATDNPKITWHATEGKLIANVGNYSLSGAYGGWKLVQIVSEAGGERDISNMGYSSKRELYYWMTAFLNGLATERRRSE